MSIEIHGSKGHLAMRHAAAAARATLMTVAARVRAGTTTAEIDQWVRADTAARGGTPSQLGYEGFPAAVCTSPNDVICHGIPSDAVRLRLGDIVNIDVTTELAGYHGDTSLMVIVGTPSDDAVRLVAVCQRALYAGIAEVRPGGRIGDIGAAIADLAAAEGLGVVTAFTGHGIGREMHMSPSVPHSGRRGQGVKLKPGMAFTIEPMLTVGSPRGRVLDDGWTTVTADGSLSAQWEHTLFVTHTGVEVLTARPEEAAALCSIGAELPPSTGSPDA